jgi:hypothetical protein
MSSAATVKFFWEGEAVAESDNVVSLTKWQEQRVTAASEELDRQTQRFEVTTSIGDRTVAQSERMLAVEDLYPGLDPQKSILASALLLLGESETKLTEAAKAADDGDQISADDAAQRFQALLPELFCCRSLGDSFATVINALFHGLKNLRGTPVSGAQIAQMRNSISVLRRRPFLEYREALDIVARLEAAKLRIDPQGLTAIQEVLLG